MQFKSQNLKLKISGLTPNQSPTNLGCCGVGVNCLLVFQTFSLIPPSGLIPPGKWLKSIPYS